MQYLQDADTGPSNPGFAHSTRQTSSSGAGACVVALAAQQTPTPLVQRLLRAAGKAHKAASHQALLMTE